MKSIYLEITDWFGFSEVINLWKDSDGHFYITVPEGEAGMTRDNAEQLIAELESLLRED